MALLEESNSVVICFSLVSIFFSQQLLSQQLLSQKLLTGEHLLNQKFSVNNF